MENISPIIRVMSRAVRKVASFLNREFNELETLQTSKKGTAGFAQISQKNAEKILIQELIKVRPDYGIKAPIAGDIEGKDDKFRWIISAIDGIDNFKHSVKDFAINVALEETKPNGRKYIVASVIDLPIYKISFWSEKGQGAWYNNALHDSYSKLRVAGRSKVQDIMLSVNSAIDDNYEFIKEVGNVRAIGCASLSLLNVALGKFDCFIGDNINLCCIAAASLMVQEAGGVVTNYKNDNILTISRNVIAANEQLHSYFYKKIKSK